MTRKSTVLTLLLLTILASQVVVAQGSAGSGGKFEPRFLVDIPTAGMLDKGSFALDINFFQQGGVILGLSAGILDRLSFGLSYGGSNLIGAGTPTMNDVPGINVKVRVIEENILFPAIAIGFDSQGKDGYIKSLSRYVVKSPGFYAAASKNYAMLGFLSIHGGVNYSLERADDDRDVNAFAGVEKTLGPFVSAVLEYNAALNDNSGRAIGKGRGYINAGLKWSVSGGLTLSVNFKDLAENARGSTSTNRTVTLEYVRFF